MRSIQSGFLVLGCYLFFFFPTTFAQGPSRPRLAIDRSPGISFLREIEERILPLPLVAGVPRHPSLSDYYWDANVPLRVRLDEAVRAFKSGQPARFRALTVIAGTAGVGKTFVKRGVYQDGVPENHVWKFDLRELFRELADQQLAEFKPDVHHGKEVINRLLCLTPAGREQFRHRLESQSPAFVVIDSLDEIHPQDYSFVLSELERLALDGDRAFIHVVVFGRPLVFRDYWRERLSSGIPAGLRSYVLNPPDFRTTGDLLVSSWNYACWKYGLSRTDADGKSRQMTLTEYQRWSESDFDLRGNFANVSCQANVSMRPDVRDELRKWSMQHRVVAAVLPNLAGNSMVREIVEDHVARGMPFDERQFMEAFFAKWLERDTQSVDRPSRLKSQHLELYVKLLEAVAAKYIDEQRVDRLGYFEVFEEDRAMVQHRGKTVSVPVRRLLNRSGLVNLDPVLPETARYRFEPFWFHRLLLQMHGQRESSRDQRPTGDLTFSSTAVR